MFVPLDIKTSLYQSFGHKPGLYLPRKLFISFNIDCRNKLGAFFITGASICDTLWSECSINIFIFIDLLQITSLILQDSDLVVILFEVCFIKGPQIRKCEQVGQNLELLMISSTPYQSE